MEHSADMEIYRDGFYRMYGARYGDVKRLQTKIPKSVLKVIDIHWNLHWMNGSHPRSRGRIPRKLESMLWEENLLVKAKKLKQSGSNGWQLGKATPYGSSKESAEKSSTNIIQMSTNEESPW
jgi:hypothetical protein